MESAKPRMPSEHSKVLKYGSLRHNCFSCERFPVEETRCGATVWHVYDVCASRCQFLVFAEESDWAAAHLTVKLNHLDQRWGKHSTLLNGSVLMRQCVCVFKKVRKTTHLFSLQPKRKSRDRQALSESLTSVCVCWCVCEKSQELWSRNLTHSAATLNLWPLSRGCGGSPGVRTSCVTQFGRCSLKSGWEYECTGGSTVEARETVAVRWLTAGKGERSWCWVWFLSGCNPS